MSNLVRIGTLTWATWQADEPRHEQYGTIQHLAMDNLVMELWDGQLSTQWHHLTGNLAHSGNHAMGIVGTLLYDTMGNLTHNGIYGTGNLSCNCTPRLAT